MAPPHSSIFADPEHEKFTQQLPLHLKFAHRLAHNSPTVRRATLNRLSKYLRRKQEFTSEDLLKLWKGLFYCIWLTDHASVQDEIADKLSSLIEQFPIAKDISPSTASSACTSSSSSAFLTSLSPPSGLIISSTFDYRTYNWWCQFVHTFIREWPGIDRLRMDKFQRYVRKQYSAYWRWLLKRIMFECDELRKEELADINRRGDPTTKSSATLKQPKKRTMEDAKMEDVDMELDNPAMELNFESMNNKFNVKSISRGFSQALFNDEIVRHRGLAMHCIDVLVNELLTALSDNSLVITNDAIDLSSYAEVKGRSNGKSQSKRQQSTTPTPDSTHITTMTLLVTAVFQTLEPLLTLVTSNADDTISSKVISEVLWPLLNLIHESEEQIQAKDETIRLGSQRLHDALRLPDSILALHGTLSNSVKVANKSRWRKKLQSLVNTLQPLLPETQPVASVSNANAGAKRKFAGGLFAIVPSASGKAKKLKLMKGHESGVETPDNETNGTVEAEPEPTFTTPTKKQKQNPVTNAHHDILRTNKESFDDVEPTTATKITTDQTQSAVTSIAVTPTIPSSQQPPIFSTPQAKKPSNGSNPKVSMTAAKETKETPQSVRFSLKHNRTQEFDFRLPVEVKHSSSDLLQRPTPKPALKHRSMLP